MKVLATLNKLRLTTKPGKSLGFVLFGLIVVTVVGVAYQLYLPKGAPAKLKADHLLAVVGVLVAAIGALFAGWLSVHNTIRQHTITTLLDSRLSETYMRYADVLCRHYTSYDARIKANPALRESPTDNIDILALRYILNYFEFIAIGVRRGDFDEVTLKDSLRSILRTNVQKSMSWIRIEQMSNDRLYTNLMWLFKRWAY